MLLPPGDRHAGADGRIDAGDVARRMKVGRGADQIRRRDADQGAGADAADSERKLMSSEDQSAAAAGHAEDEAGAGDVQGDRPGRGFGRRDKGCGRETGARQNKAATRNNAHVKSPRLDPHRKPAVSARVEPKLRGAGSLAVAHDLPATGDRGLDFTGRYGTPRIAAYARRAAGRVGEPAQDARRACRPHAWPASEPCRAWRARIDHDCRGARAR